MVEPFILKFQNPSPLFYTVLSCFARLLIIHLLIIYIVSCELHITLLRL